MPQNAIQCPPGYIKRTGYTRRFRNSIKEKGFTVRRKGKIFNVHPSTGNIHVPAHCIRPRRKAKNVTRKIGPLRKGLLIKYGYQYRLPDRMRHAALERAVGAYGRDQVVPMLTAIANLTVRSAPDAHRIFTKDRDWVMEHYPK
jgi:hypothetical protein